MGNMRAHSILSSATTYWAETSYTVEQYQAKAGSVTSGEHEWSDGIKELTNGDDNALLCNVFDLEVLENDGRAQAEAIEITPTFPTTLELEMEWACFNLHRVEFHWLQMHATDPPRSRMDVTFIKVLWEGMKFPEKKVYNPEQVQRLSRTAAALSYFRQSRPPFAKPLPRKKFLQGIHHEPPRGNSCAGPPSQTEYMTSVEHPRLDSITKAALLSIPPMMSS
ncbi:hypothetical protein H310_09847 [Aphanomyces invadans]|uniref:Uncharacterized protein n=1 Tax=Aphanomyces invadans TaxID=157072 RepID=A0A024TTQ4_9STRA|nr:hypothetical protein H310_09847 [Aphanomyces invadans]ETV97001.1 hypothetical protein H310_09847 [Aphanomyces invadans]|eukprot:XP_008874247.1 hypothetical protein H310_09847 [Aphanomyces invadans]